MRYVVSGGDGGGEMDKIPHPNNFYLIMKDVLL